MRIPLRNFEEVLPVSSRARGSFRADIHTTGSQIAHVPRHEGLQGEVRQAHIRIGRRGANGRISVLLCQTEANPDPAAVAPTCPSSGSVSAVLTIANII